MVARSEELNVNDPPGVTRQKAMGILEALRPWANLLAAGRSTGLINDGIADYLQRHQIANVADLVGTLDLSAADEADAAA